MKTLVVAIFALVTATAAAQPPPTLAGFLGIPWGASIDSARATMHVRSDAVFDAALSSATTLVYVDGTFAGQAIRAAALHFIDGRFAVAIVFFARPAESIDDADDPVVARFRELWELVAAKYGRPNDNEETWARWVFPVLTDGTATRWDIPSDDITLSITTRQDITLTYRNGARVERARLDELEKNLDDL